MLDSDGFRHLTTLSASRSALTGTLPLSFALATDLRILVLADPISIGIHGTFPTEYGSFSNLMYGEFKILRGINGTLPQEYGKWESAIGVSFWGNLKVKGTIPTEWGLMTNLEVLKIGMSSVSGTIPSELGNLSFLRELMIMDNDVSGSVPSEICSLRTAGVLSTFETNCVGDNPKNALVECMSPDCCTFCSLTLKPID